MAAKISKLPGVISQIEDGGLNVTPRTLDLNKSILIIGTAEDGPMYEPLPLATKDEAVSAYGRFGRGTLVRGLFEAFDTSIGTPDIRAIRVGDGQRSYLNIAEKTGTTLNAATTDWTALKLEARFPGSVYNQVSVGVDNNRNIVIYNPKTAVWSSFSYDSLNSKNPNVDARNVLELANAINADTNLRDIIVASVVGIPAAFEIYVNSASDGVYSDGVTSRIRMSEVLATYTVATPGDVINPGSGWFNLSPQVAATAGNWINELSKVYSVTISEPYVLETAGKASAKLKLNPLDGKSDYRISTIQALEDYDSDYKWQYSPGGVNSGVVSEYVLKVTKQLINQYPTTSGGYDGAGYLTFNAEMCPDDSEAGYTNGSGLFESDTAAANGVASGYINGLAATTYNKYVYSASTWFTATTKNMINSDDTVIASGTPIIEVSDVNTTDDSYWTVVPYNHTNGVYISEWDSSTKVGKLAFGASASGTTTAGLLDNAGAIKKDKFVRISYYSVKDFLTEASTLAELETNTTDYKTYFVRGDEILFSNVLPSNIIINQGVNTEFEVGTDVVIGDSEDGEIVFPNRSLQPGQGGIAISASNKSIIGFQYEYLPQFPNISTSYQSLNNGTNGTELSNEKLYTEFGKAYTNLENYNVDIVVPMGAFLDATKTGYNPRTGLRENVNAQFHIQLGDFLEQVSINTNETVGVIGVNSPSTTSVSDVNNWVKSLTEIDLSDPLRGANIINLFDNYRVSVTAFDAFFGNVGGTSYFANGAVAYASQISYLPPHHAPTNKTIRNIIRNRFDLSNAQLEKLMESRYVTMRKRTGGRNPVITDAVTLAAPGSDFVRLSTVMITFNSMNIVREVCDPFIGMPNSLEHRNAMKQSITRGLQAMVSEGAIRAFDFEIISTPDMQVLGDIDIELIIVPVFEIRKIRTIVKLRKSLGNV